MCGGDECIAWITNSITENYGRPSDIDEKFSCSLLFILGRGLLISVNLSVREMFGLAKVPVRYFESRSYLALQLSCIDTCQILTWYFTCKGYHDFEKLGKQGNGINCLSYPTRVPDHHQTKQNQTCTKHKALRVQRYFACIFKQYCLNIFELFIIQLLAIRHRSN